jgi:phosphate transport system substrate-binding protein
VLVVLVPMFLALSACGRGAPLVVIDGSSTVYPLGEAIAEAFLEARPDIHVIIGVSGTGGGFKKFCHGETTLQHASRPIKKSEVAACRESGRDFIEIPIAYDGIVIARHPENDWLDHLTVDELKRIWEPAADGRVMRWSDIRPGFPDAPLRLFGAGVDSGTYDYFTQAVVGEEHASRGDFTSSEDDNVLVQGIARDRYALGFFGFAYFDENRERVAAVPIVPREASTPVTPSLATIRDGSYAPLSRPLFVYISASALDEPGTRAYSDYLIAHAATLAPDVGLIPMPDAALGPMRDRLAKRIAGSVFESGGSQVGVTLESLLAAPRSAKSMEKLR